MASMNSPDQVLTHLCTSGEKKLSRTVFQTLILAILAGVYIGFASHLATVAGTGSTEWPGAKNILVGSVFSLGLMLVLIPGAELFTGNNLIVISVLQKKATWGSMTRNWIIVYAGNLIGSLALALLLVFGTESLTGEVGQRALHIASSKAQLSPLQAFTRGIGANWLVCLAIWMAFSAQDTAGKILGMFFPVMAFVAMGFEHSVANMYMIPAGALLQLISDAAPQFSTVDIIRNIVWVTMGNIIGGGFFVGGVYWFLYAPKTQRRSALARETQVHGRESTFNLSSSTLKH